MLVVMRFNIHLADGERIKLQVELESGYADWQNQRDKRSVD